MIIAALHACLSLALALMPSRGLPYRNMDDNFMNTGKTLTFVIFTIIQESIVSASSSGA